MENAAEQPQVYAKTRKKRGGGRFCAAIIRWVFILLFAVVLLGGLYFKAPPKVLVVDALLLALLTVVPKQKRKYGWLVLAAAALAIAVWTFIPEKDTGDWRPYTFDAELAALESERIVPPEDNAAPLYEALFQRWEQIEENDPFPEEADKEDVTWVQPWTAEEFPEVAVWFKRHDAFFHDVLVATQKPGCYFPAVTTTLGLSKSMERLSPFKQFSQHLIRASYLDLGEGKNTSDVWEKQFAVLNLGKHINQQPLIIDMLVGVAIEGMAYGNLKRTLMQESIFENVDFDDIAIVKNAIQTNHFGYVQKWQQMLAYEKLFAKNFWGMYYEVNHKGNVRYSRGKSKIDLMNQIMGLEDTVGYTYWDGVRSRFFVITFWLGGLPKEPMKASGMIDAEWDAQKAILGKMTTKAPPIDELFDDLIQTGFQFNYRYLASTLIQMSFSNFEKIQNEILPKYRTQKEGAEIVCKLVLYKKQHGEYPIVLDEIWQAGEDGQTVSEIYAGFVYNKTNDSFKLYHIGQNGVDENAEYQMPELDPNSATLEGLMGMKPEPDDILIWPEKLEESD